MNDLTRYFQDNTGRLIHKWMHYFDIYDRHFSRFRNKDVTVLEIGVAHGGSLQMWRHYFGPRAKLFGVDIDPKCKAIGDGDVTIFIGLQEDRNFLRNLKKQIPPVDILIDDGGHTMRQQIVTFEELFDHIKPDGVYLAEDLHTSYWLYYGGGHKRRGTFIEYSKNCIDLLNAHHSQQKSLRVNSFTTSVDSLHFYDSVLVIEKRTREHPHHLSTGSPSFEVVTPSPTLRERWNSKRLSAINRLLRIFRLPGYKWR